VDSRTCCNVQGLDAVFITTDKQDYRSAFQTARQHLVQEAQLHDAQLSQRDRATRHVS